MKALSVALTAVLALSLGVTGCKRPQKPLTAIPGQGRIGAPGGGDNMISIPNPGLANGANTSSLTSTDPTAGRDSGSGKELPSGQLVGTPDRAALAAFTVYFDYDSSAVKASEKAKVHDVAADLK